MWVPPWYFVRGGGCGRGPAGQWRQLPRSDSFQEPEPPSQRPRGRAERRAGKAISVPQSLSGALAHLAFSWLGSSVTCFLSSSLQSQGKLASEDPKRARSQGRENTFTSTALWGRPSFLCRALRTWIYLLCDFLFKLSPGAPLISESLI